MTYEGTHVLLCSYGEAVAPGRHWCDPPLCKLRPRGGGVPQPFRPD